MPSPAYVLGAVPIPSTRLVEFLEEGPGSITMMLQRPHAYRHAGWDLQTLDSARLVDGDYLEVRNGARKIIQLFEDGTFIYHGVADSSLLGWGREPEVFPKAPRLNPLALIETTMSFVDFYATLIPHLENYPSKVAFQVEFQNGFIDGRPLYLNPGSVNALHYVADDEQHLLPKADVQKDLVVEAKLVAERPNRVAYLLMEEVYRVFGMPSSKIPYTMDGPVAGEREISVTTFGRR